MKVKELIGILSNLEQEKEIGLIDQRGNSLVDADKIAYIKYLGGYLIKRGD